MTLKEHILTTRPYSYIDIILVGILALVIASGGLSFNIALLYAVLVSFCWWMFMLLIVERRKNDKINRLSYFVPLIPLVLIVAVTNIWGLLLICLAPPLLLLYGWKSKYRIFGFTSPIFRAALTMLLFLLILSINNSLNYEFVQAHWSIIAAITLFVLARNLIGDIRDADVDKNSIPREIGIPASYGLVIGIMAVAILLIPDIFIIFPFLSLIILIPVLKDGYVLHRYYLLSSMFFLLNYTISLLVAGHNILLLTNLTFVGVLLNFTYDSVPRTRKIRKR